MFVYRFIQVGLWLIVLLSMTAGCAPEKEARTINWWDLLSPEEWAFYKDYDPLAAFDASSLPPVKANPDLEDSRVKIPGYTVNLDGNFQTGSNFLLVPTVGACVHVPPPPENQIIYAQSENSFPYDLFTPVWVYGLLSINDFSNQYADGLYTMVVEKVEPYTDSDSGGDDS